WALLAQANLLLPGNRPELVAGPIEPARRIVQDALAKGEMAARKAIEIDPGNALAYGALARARQISGKWAESDDLSKKAVALDPGDPEALSDYINSLTAKGYLRAALAIARKLRELEPLAPGYSTMAANLLQINGQI